MPIIERSDLKLERQVGNGVMGSAFIGKMKKHTTVFVKEINDIDQPSFLKHVGSIRSLFKLMCSF